MLTTVKLYGPLRKKYGKEFKFAASSVGEVIKALCANFKSFREDLRKYNYNVFRDFDDLSYNELNTKFSNKTIRLVPLIAGSKNAGAQIIIGIGLIALGGALGATYAAGIGAAAASFSTAVGWSLVFGGVSQLLFKPPKEDLEKTAESKFFNGPVNNVGQGYPVPLGYGELIVGGHTISQSIYNSYELL